MAETREFLAHTLLELEKVAKWMISEYGPAVQPVRKRTIAEQYEDARRKEDGMGLFSIDMAKMNTRPLRLLMRMFQTKLSMEVGAPPGVPQALFTKHISPILVPNASAMALEGLTARIDTDANGVIDWEEFSSYLLEDHSQTDQHDSFDSLYGTAPVTNPQSMVAGGKRGVRTAHKETIHKLLVTPERYYTASLDGTVKMWQSGTMDFIATMHNDSGAARSRYIVDMAFLPQSNRVAIFQIDRTVTLYDAATGQIHKLYKGADKDTWICQEKSREIPDLIGVQPDMMGLKKDSGEMQDVRKELRKVQGRAGRVSNSARTRRIEISPIEGLQHSPMCVEVVSRSMSERLFPGLAEPVFIGLELGYVHLYDFRKAAGRAGEGDIGIKREREWRPHTAWVVAVQTCDRLDNLITLSMDRTLEIFSLTKNERVHLLEPGEGSPGILGFRYSDEMELMAAWGVSGVSLWNPAMSTPTRLSLNSAVVSVRFNHEENQVLVLTDDKTVHVYDMRSTLCVQQLVDKVLRRPENRLTTLEYDTNRKCIVTTAAHPIVFVNNKSVGVNDDAGRVSTNRLHRYPVTSVLYSSGVHQVLSADMAKVNIWDVNTGQKMSSWSLGKQIMSVCMDTGQRRVFISCPGGVLSVFNAVSGEELKSLTNPYTFEITCIQHVDNGQGPDVVSLIIAAGWSNKVLIWSDTAGEFFVPLRSEVLINAQYGHVYSAARFASQTGSKLALGTSSGHLLIYDLDSTMSCFAVLSCIPSRGTSTAPLQPAPPTGRGARPSAAGRPAAFDTFSSQQREGLLNIVEQVLVYSQNTLITLSGNGLVVIWRISKRESTEVLTAFYAPVREGDEAFALAASAELGMVAVGDASGYVSVFNVSGAFAARGGSLATVYLQHQQRMTMKGSRRGSRGTAATEPLECDGTSEGSSPTTSAFAMTPVAQKMASTSPPGMHIERERAERGAGLVNVDAGLRLAKTAHAVSLLSCFRPFESVITSLVWVGAEKVFIAACKDDIKLFTMDGGAALSVGASTWDLDADLRTPPSIPNPQPNCADSVMSSDSEGASGSEDDSVSPRKVGFVAAETPDDLMKSHQWMHFRAAAIPGSAAAKRTYVAFESSSPPALRSGGPYASQSDAQSDTRDNLSRSGATSVCMRGVAMAESKPRILFGTPKKPSILSPYLFSRPTSARRDANSPRRQSRLDAHDLCAPPSPSIPPAAAFLPTYDDKVAASKAEAKEGAGQAKLESNGQQQPQQQQVSIPRPPPPAVPGQDGLLPAKAPRVREELMELLVKEAPPQKSGRSRGSRVSNEDKEPDKIDLDQFDVQRFVSWVHQNDFTPRPLANQVPPAYQGHCVRPPPAHSWQRTSPTQQSAKSDAASSRRRVLGQFTRLFAHEGIDDPSMQGLMATSERMQAEVQVKRNPHQTAERLHDPTRSQTSYTKLRSKPLRDVRGDKPFPESQKVRRRNKLRGQDENELTFAILPG
eukprot:TRINITY_DN2977_c0_g1_i1.p1 TRINITY_DN2977_c0_g1~~TRINITY_DN2977_c0_g1_i1.p1  ORF type:complete len:1511 (+),score=496.23 TRINITY_DN2977_c0_g1_i1:121-4533(+)